MPIDIASIQTDVAALLDHGLAAIDDALQREFESGCAEPSLVTALHGLRSRYIFDKMRVIRATIAADDHSAAQAEALASLNSAVVSLDEVQEGAARENSWIDRTSDALDKLFTIYSKLASI